MPIIKVIYVYNATKIFLKCSWAFTYNNNDAVIEFELEELKKY